MSTRREIKKWMVDNIARFVDRRTGEVDCTTMVETWDYETQDGGSTTDPDHEAWDVAVKVAEQHEKKSR